MERNQGSEKTRLKDEMMQQEYCMNIWCFMKCLGEKKVEFVCNKWYDVPCYKGCVFCKVVFME